MGLLRSTFVELGEFRARRVHDLHLAVFDDGRAGVAHERDLAVFCRGVDFDLRHAAFPAVARQTAEVEHAVKLAVAQGDHLGADLHRLGLIGRLELALILALNGEVGTGFGRIGKRGVIGRKAVIGERETNDGGKHQTPEHGKLLKTQSR